MNSSRPRDACFDFRGQVVGVFQFGHHVALAIAHELAGIWFQNRERSSQERRPGDRECRVDADDLVVDAHRLVLSLLEQLDHAITAIKSSLGGWIEFRTELSERFQFAERSQVETQTTGDLSSSL